MVDGECPVREGASKTDARGGESGCVLEHEQEVDREE